MIEQSSAEPRPLSDSEQQELRFVVGSMIPASNGCGMPGADDDLIFAEILAEIGSSADRMREALQQLDRLAGGRFAVLDRAAQASVAEALRRDFPVLFLLLVNHTARCYYRDDRVMRKLGMEVRPPFPLGFEVEQGDWSLLDPVRVRGKVYRDVP